MSPQRISLRIVITLATTATLVMAGSAWSAPRNMVGSILVENPSAGFTLQPGIYGRKAGGAGPRLYPPTAGVPIVSVAGTAASTFVGRTVTVPANQLNRTGFSFRDFPAFANVGQVSLTFMTIQNAATFAEGGGALAACPGGDGCAAVGTAISWCPPTAHNPLAPAPGTPGTPATATAMGDQPAQIGNWNCASWQAGAGGGDRFLRQAITNASGRPNFGGTLILLRNHIHNVWRVPGQPSTPNANDAEVTRSFMLLNDKIWSPGRPNFEYTGLPGNRGPRLLARLNANGAIAATFGCVNGIGTPGTPYIQGVAQPVLGNNCGTNTAPQPDGQGWGFKMTTGTISGSDPYPFGLVVTTVAGTPFNPTFGAQPASLGFFFSRMGTDAITGSGNRNLVLLGGGVAVDPASGNAFFRISALRMNMSVPEPATGLGLIAGAGLLIGLVRRRARA